ncbi:MAG: NCS2 family permease [Bacteroidales bacterium]|nr:NCS2 family permease [Bacteroidales bacterium]
MLKKLFGLDTQKTSVRTEIFAGFTSFLTMSYILAVNPSLFSALEGMHSGAVFTTTALVAVIGTLICAFVAKMPFGIAPGMGSNAFFIFTICLGMGYSWKFALTAVFIEGIILFLLTITNLREALITAMPPVIKHSISIGIGLFITFVGLQNAGLVVNDESTLISLGDITQGSGLLSTIGLVITSLLVIRNVKGGMLIGILITTLIGIPMGLTHYQGVISAPQSISPIFCSFEWDKILTADMVIVVLSFLFIDLFSLTGAALGICIKGGFADRQGNVPGIKRLFLADSLGTVAAGMFGTSAACTLIESSTGVAQGGRSGLTAFVIAVCFCASLFFSPLFLAIPASATAPVLIIVGLMMFSSVKELPLEDMSEAIPGFITIIMMPLAYSIADGILLGTISYVVINLLCGNFRKMNPGMYILSAVFALKYIFF